MAKPSLRYSDKAQLVRGALPRYISFCLQKPFNE
jgi:hypothetical protein